MYAAVRLYLLSLGPSNMFLMGFPGDLMTALLLAWLEKHPRNLRHAVESALAGLQGVLQRTHEMSGLTSGTTEKTAEVLPVRCMCGWVLSRGNAAIYCGRTYVCDCAMSVFPGLVLKRSLGLFLFPRAVSSTHRFSVPQRTDLHNRVFCQRSQVRKCLSDTDSIGSCRLQRLVSCDLFKVKGC
jgi:hypothetical protein